MRWAMGLAVALLFIGGCTEEKGDCRWAAETLCENMFTSASDADRERLSDAEAKRVYDLCVATKIIDCGSIGGAR